MLRDSSIFNDLYKNMKCPSDIKEHGLLSGFKQASIVETGQLGRWAALVSPPHSTEQIDPLTCPVGNSHSHWRG